MTNPTSSCKARRVHRLTRAGRLPFLFLGILINDGLQFASLLELPDYDFEQQCQQLRRQRPELLRIANTAQTWWKVRAAQVLCRTEFYYLAQSQAFYIDIKGVAKDLPRQTMRFVTQCELLGLQRSYDPPLDVHHSVEIYQTSEPDIGLGLRTLTVSVCKMSKGQDACSYRLL